MRQFDIQKLDQLVSEGKLMVQFHPTLPLRIYKYTPELQFSRGWDELTSRCRGLVVDNEGFQYSNPIPKFFNIEELEPLGLEIPNLPYEITDKVDGSCIEVFWYTEKVHPFHSFLVTCTLGSFTSDQAKLAEKIIGEKLTNATDYFRFRDGFTYIFELVAPENRIVLDYGDTSTVILLTIRNNDNDKDIRPDEFGRFPVVEKINKTIEEILIEKKREDFTNKEGFVVKFSNGLRVKVKYEEYFRLHKIMTGVNEKFVWEFLRDGKPLPLENVPDEFFKYVTEVKSNLLSEYSAVELSAKNSFEEIYRPYIDRKSFALEALKRPYSSVLFKMFEDMDYSKLIWKIIEPKMTETKKFNSFRGTNDNTGTKTVS